ncbi:hypothetical protein CCACVL1_30443 [Corchorus capsularis]|uniref:Uncharacterized protein n=1 Tax=Corchorus capsularis TaxID=210143 RepID=A0A1R3FXD5_COCAP|nr:hypothetical protein CCACVL1_30443 [Corchorus capsularis]
MVVIITETRLGSAEAHQLANRLRYRQVISQEPTGYCGGIWVFSDLRNLSMQHIFHGDNEIEINLLRV